MTQNLIRTVLFIFLLSLFSNATAQSPYELNKGNEATLLSFGTTINIAGLFTTAQTSPLSIDEINRVSKSEINRFERFAVDNWSPKSARWSDLLLGAFIALPATFYFNEETRNDDQIISVLYAEVLLVSYGLTRLTKGFAQRIRPFVYNPDPGIPLSKKQEKDAKLSFFSGHSSVSFASAVFTATVFSDYFPNSKWKYPVWGAALSGAALTGLLRVQAGKHFPTDVLVGAAVGGLTGYLIPRSHRINSSQNVNVTPGYGQNQFQIYLNFSF